MKTSLDCIPCFFRQALEAARMVSADPAVHKKILREVLKWAAKINLDQPPPLVGQRIHRRLREITGVKDPYRAEKERLNRMAMDLLGDLKPQIDSAEDPLMASLRLAIGGNIIDMGAHGSVTEPEVRRSLFEALAKPLSGDWEVFLRAVAGDRKILYLADNAGEIVFDRDLIERLSPARVTLAVRGFPVLNDATLADARAVGLHEIVEVIDNGSDAPGTVPGDCSKEFRKRFKEADVILAKGQGNFETLSDEPRDIFFLFKAKCPVIAAHVGHPVGSLVVRSSSVWNKNGYPGLKTADAAATDGKP